jgi:hypothetical protein
MKKRSLSKKINRYFKKLRLQYELLRSGPASLQVDLGRKR